MEISSISPGNGDFLIRLSGRQRPLGNNQVIMCNVQPHGTTEPLNHGTSSAKWDAQIFLVIRVSVLPLWSDYAKKLEF